MARERARMRLLFDELASPRVARALAALDLQVEHVGGPAQPPRGSDDAVVLTAAHDHNQTIVTNNHDMIVLCAESTEPVIWLDPMDKDMSFPAQTLMCFSQIEHWEKLLAEADGPACIQAHKTTCRVITLPDAKRLAIQRGKRRRQQERRRAKAQELGGLLGEKELVVSDGSRPPRPSVPTARSPGSRSVDSR